MKPTRLLTVILCVGQVAASVATADLREGLVAYYQFEGDLTDASGEGHDARPSGGGTASFTDGFLGQAVDTRQTAVDCGTWDPSDENTNAFSASCWVYWLGLPGAAARWQGVLAKRTGWGAGLSRWQLELGDGSATAYLTNQPNGGAGSVTLVPDEWQHIAMSYDGSTAALYLNGAQVGGGAWTLDNDMDATLCIGMSQATNANRFNGSIDEVAFWNRGLAPDEIALVYNGGAGQSLTGPPVTATKPSPASGAGDVPNDTALSWTPAASAVSHQVYFGTSWSDVNDARPDDPRGVLVSASQQASRFLPAGPLEFGRTYHWRIDEVGAAPEHAVFRGQVWSFTVEPFGYPLTNVTATASGFQPGMGPQNTVNGSGLNNQDQHSTEPSQMWLTDGARPAWIQFEFERTYALDAMWVWNSNQLIEGFLGLGARDVTIEHSVDGATWTPLAGVPEFARAPGLATYTANTIIDFDGVRAQYVRITINTNWGGVAPQTGLAEVRFFYVPVQARAPWPATGAAGVAIDTELNWRPGRQATSHEVLLGTDRAAVADGTVAAQTVTEHSYLPAALNFGTTYFWKVNEIGAAGVYAGDLWSFTTQEDAVIDDFESYTDQEGREIFATWIDGFTTGLSGSTVGYLTATGGTFGETKIVHGGKQSMPLQYDNTAAPFYSEAERTFATAQDWATHGADRLVVYFRGFTPAFAETASGSILMNAMGADIWNESDQFRFAYKTLNGDGTMVARVDRVVNSNVWAKAGVMIRQSTGTGSVHAFMPLTPGGASAGNGASFQRRLTAGAGSTSEDSPTLVAAPYWVKIERKGNSFSGSIAPDGQTWSQVGTTQTIPMTNPVLIGLALCSHDAAVATGATFSRVATTGNVTGAWQVAEIGPPQPEGNSVEGLYLAVQDTAGKTKVVQHPDPTATAAMTWQTWAIPLREFTAAGVQMTAVKSLTIGVGNRAAPPAGGTGTVYLDDIGFGHGAP